MKTLDLQQENTCCRITQIEGTYRFISRVTSLGLSVDATILVLQNRKTTPLLLYSKHTIIALNRKDAQNIFVTDC